MQCISSRGGQPMQLPDTQMRQSTLPAILVHWLQFQYTTRHSIQCQVFQYSVRYSNTVPGTPVQFHARQFQASKCCMRESQNIKALHFSTVLYVHQSTVLYLNLYRIHTVYLWTILWYQFSYCVFILYLYRIVVGAVQCGYHKNVPYDRGPSSLCICVFIYLCICIFVLYF